MPGTELPEARARVHHDSDEKQIILTKQFPSELLTSGDPDPVDRACVNGGNQGLLVCEHGGREIPRRLNNLGLHDSVMEEHIAYDIGAEATARLIAPQLAVPLLVQRFSRLVIDCNRPPSASDAMPSLIHGTTVPGNENLDRHASQQRIDEIFTPFNNAIAEQVEASTCQWAFSIHSFTPQLNGQNRPWSTLR